jgi:hypothetical protein
LVGVETGFGKDRLPFLWCLPLWEGFPVVALTAGEVAGAVSAKTKPEVAPAKNNAKAKTNSFFMLILLKINQS